MDDKYRMNSATTYVEREDDPEIFEGAKQGEEWRSSPVDEKIGLRFTFGHSSQGDDPYQRVRIVSLQGGLGAHCLKVNVADEQGRKVGIPVGFPRAGESPRIDLIPWCRPWYSLTRSHGVVETRTGMLHPKNQIRGRNAEKWWTSTTMTCVLHGEKRSTSS